MNTPTDASVKRLEGEEPTASTSSERQQAIDEWIAELLDDSREEAALSATTEGEKSTSPPDAAPAPESLEDAAEEELPAIPGYEVVELLGRGGMGYVYKARQIDLKRLVALKLIRSGKHAGRSERARFRSEAEAAARLQHPAIVQIHDVGEHEGCPYLCLEYVDGGSLEKKIGGTPQPPLWAAQLIEMLARAVHYAHEHGIVHRDLKPGNVLLADDGMPKIADFGLAKLVDADAVQAQTQTGAILGTASYMAPEQASGEIRAIARETDVYALGAILYELLTGRPPFKGGSMMETLEQVRTREPVSPTQLQPKVHRDLETICLKCLRKEPPRRYRTAEELADDLKRFVNREPILARPVGLIERTWRWCRRRPLVAGLVGTLILVLAGGLAGITWQWLRAETETKRNKDNLELALEALEEVYLQVASDRLPRAQELSQADRELLRRVLHFYQAFADRNSETPTVLDQTVSAHVRVGSIQGMLGNTKEAEAAYRRALDLLAQAPAVADWRMTIQIWIDLGGLYVMTNRAAEAKQPYDQVQAILEGLRDEEKVGPDYREGLAELFQSRGLRLVGVLNQSSPGPEETLRAEHHEAAWCYGQALELRQQLVTEFPQEWRYWRQLAATYNSQGILLRRMRRPDQADAAYRQFLELQAKLVARFPGNSAMRFDQGMGHRNLAILLKASGQMEHAVKQYRKALDVLASLAQDFPSVPSFHTEVGQALQGLATLLLSTDGSLDECRQLLERAAQHQKTAVKLAPDQLTYQNKLFGHLFHLSGVLVALGEHEEAARVAEQMKVVATRSMDSYAVAARFAECAEVAEKDPKLNEEQRRERARTYARPAAEILRRFSDNDRQGIDAIIRAGMLGEGFDDCATLLRELEKRLPAPEPLPCNSRTPYCAIRIVPS